MLKTHKRTTLLTTAGALTLGLAAGSATAEASSSLGSASLEEPFLVAQLTGDLSVGAGAGAGVGSGAGAGIDAGGIMGATGAGASAGAGGGAGTTLGGSASDTGILGGTKTRARGGTAASSGKAATPEHSEEDD